jgi:hypothetical protein
MEVLAAVCESYSADASVGEWLARAVAEAERSTATLSPGSEGTAVLSGILQVRILGEMAPPGYRMRAQEGADR